MGSRLAPVLANIFKGFNESKLLNEYNLNTPKFYLRYADDILAAFDNEQDSLTSLMISVTSITTSELQLVIMVMFNLMIKRLLK